MSYYSVCLKGLAGKHRVLWSDHWPTRAVCGVSLLTGRWLAGCAASRGHCGSSERGRGCTQNNPGWLHPNFWVRSLCFHRAAVVCQRREVNSGCWLALRLFHYALGQVLGVHRGGQLLLRIHSRWKVGGGAVTSCAIPRWPCVSGKGPLPSALGCPDCWSQHEPVILSGDCFRKGLKTQLLKGS